MNTKFLKKLRSTAALYGVKVHVHYDKDPSCGGHAHSNADTICIFYNYSTTQESMLMALFHEIGHCVAFHDGKFLPYHTAKGDETYMKRFALKAELYVDNWAEKEFYRMFPNKTFIRSYRNKEDRDYLLNWIDDGGNSDKKCYPLKHKHVRW